MSQNTGIPALINLETESAISSPPSILTACAPRFFHFLTPMIPKNLRVLENTFRILNLFFFLSTFTPISLNRF